MKAKTTLQPNSPTTSAKTLEPQELSAAEEINLQLTTGTISQKNATQALNALPDAELVALRSSPEFKGRDLETRAVEVSPKLFLHDFEIQLSEVKVKQRGDGKLEIHGLTKNDKKATMAGDDLLWKGSVLIVDGRDLDKHIKRLLVETDISQHTVVSSKVTEKLEQDLKPTIEQDLNNIPMHSWLSQNTAIREGYPDNDGKHKRYKENWRNNWSYMHQADTGEKPFWKLVVEAHNDGKTLRPEIITGANGLIQMFGKRIVPDLELQGKTQEASEALEGLVDVINKTPQALLSDKDFAFTNSEHSDIIPKKIEEICTASNQDFVKKYADMLSGTKTENLKINSSLLSAAFCNNLIEPSVVAKVLKNSFDKDAILAKLETSLNSIDPEHASEKLTVIKQAMKSPNIQQEFAKAPNVTKTSVLNQSLQASGFDELPVQNTEIPANRPLTEFDQAKENIKEKISTYSLSKSGFGDEVPNPYPSIAQSLRKFDVAKIAEIVKEMDPVGVASVILHLGDQKKSQALLEALPDKQFGEVIATKNFVNPFTKEELQEKIQARTGVDLANGGSKSAAFSKLLHGEEKGIKAKAISFVEKYATKRSQYKSFAEKVKAEKSGGVGKSI